MHDANGKPNDPPGPYRLRSPHAVRDEQASRSSAVRAVRYHAPEDLRLDEVPVPEPGAGELLLRVRNCATCGSDVRVYLHGRRGLEPPRTIGHEIAGEIATVGAGVDGWRPGDPAQVIAAIPCGNCAECAAGRANICERLTTLGHHHDGGYADYVLIPAAALRVGGVNRLPDGMPFAAAAMAEPLACVINGQELVGVGDGDEVVVVGAGPIGCLHARLARDRGASRVILVENSAERLELAADRVRPDEAVAGGPGAVDAVRGLTGGRGAAVVIVAAGSPAAQEQAIRMAAKRGRVSLFGGLLEQDAHVRLDANAVHYRELRVAGAANSTPAQNRQALEMIAGGRVAVADLITETLPLEGVWEALESVRARRGIKCVIAP